MSNRLGLSLSRVPGIGIAAMTVGVRPDKTKQALEYCRGLPPTVSLETKAHRVGLFFVSHHVAKIRFVLAWNHDRN